MTYADREWYKAQSRVACWLRAKGLTIKHAGQYGKFDLYTPNMTKIEVKWGAYKPLEYGLPAKGWKLNIQRHGEVNEGNVDFYVFLLEVDEELKAIGIIRPIFLVIPAPLRQKVVTISTRHLLSGKWKHAFDNWKIVKEFDDAKR